MNESIFQQGDIGTRKKLGEFILSKEVDPKYAGCLSILQKTYVLLTLISVHISNLKDTSSDRAVNQFPLQLCGHESECDKHFSVYLTSCSENCFPCLVNIFLLHRQRVLLFHQVYHFLFVEEEFRIRRRNQRWAILTLFQSNESTKRATKTKKSLALATSTKLAP